MSVANTCMNLNEFQTKYPIYDFSINHLSKQKTRNFTLYLNEEGYRKMLSTLQNYLAYQNEQNESVNLNSSLTL